MKALLTLLVLGLVAALSVGDVAAAGRSSSDFNDFASPPPRSWSKKRKGRPVYTPPPVTPTPAPSVELSKFVSTNLDRIVGPLDKSPMPRAELAQLRTSISSRFSRASLAERAQFQAALDVCDALSKAMDERNKASVDQYAAASWPTRGPQIKENINQLVARQKAAEVPPMPGR